MDGLGEEIEWRSSASIGQPCSFSTEPATLHYQGISPMDPLISQLIIHSYEPNVKIQTFF